MYVSIQFEVHGHHHKRKNRLQMDTPGRNKKMTDTNELYWWREETSLNNFTSHWMNKDLLIARPWTDKVNLVHAMKVILEHLGMILQVLLDWLRYYVTANARITLLTTQH